MTAVEDILRLVDERAEELVEFARALIRAPSPNPPGNEVAVAEIVEARLAELGYREIRRVAKLPHRPNLIADIGSGSPVLLLNGHLDTKPAGDEVAWAMPPYAAEIADGTLFGLGSTDMKGAVAAIVYAGAALGRVLEREGTFRVALTADEEEGAEFGVKYLAKKHAVDADAVLVAESTGHTDAWEYIGTGCRGISCFRVQVRGTQMHSSLSEALPSVNASVKLAAVLSKFDQEFRPYAGERFPGATFNLGVTVSGGVYYGIYPGQAEFGVDVRTVSGMNLADLRTEVGRFIDRLREDDPELELEVEWLPNLEWFPPCEIPDDHPLVRSAVAASRRVLGHEVPLGVMPAFTDGSHWTHLAGFPTIPAFGPGRLPLAHSPNEQVAVGELIEAAKIYALTALDYFRRVAVRQAEAGHLDLHLRDGPDSDRVADQGTGDQIETCRDGNG